MPTQNAKVPRLTWLLMANSCSDGQVLLLFQLRPPGGAKLVASFYPSQEVAVELRPNLHSGGQTLLTLVNFRAPGRSSVAPPLPKYHCPQLDKAVEFVY